MIDIKYIRDHPAAFDENLARRGLDPISSVILELDQHLRQALTELQDKQNNRNSLAKAIGQAKAKGEDIESLLKISHEYKTSIPLLEEKEMALRQELNDILIRLPNLISVDVPDGESAEDNQVITTWGTPTSFSFQPKSHVDVGQNLGLMDFETAATMSGARFVLLKGDLVRLERALASFMIDVHTQEFNYELISPPLLVKDEAVFGVGQLPKFSEDLFKTTSGHWLISTGEVPLTNMFRDTILASTQLPLRFVTHTPCFRSEAGSAGRDTRGMIRNHQFYKVELMSFTHPDQSSAEHERMRSAAEEILKRLNLPYRVMLLCTKDMGDQSSKTYDLEVWLPSEETYREISSCSNFKDYQARRVNTRLRDNDLKMHVHTLNGSGLAIGRTMVAILENYQQSDGSVIIPEVLRPYMNGQKVIS